MYVQKIIKHFEVQQKLIWSFTSLNLSNEVDIFQSFSTKSPVCVSPDSLSLRTTTQRWNFVLKYLSLENAHLICLTQTAEVSCYLQQGFENVFFLHRRTNMDCDSDYLHWNHSKKKIIRTGGTTATADNFFSVHVDMWAIGMLRSAIHLFWSWQTYQPGRLSLMCSPEKPSKWWSYAAAPQSKPCLQEKKKTMNEYVL